MHAGTLPEDLGSVLSGLQILYLDDNALNSSLPSEWGSAWPDLQRLYLQGNTLYSTLPAAWGYEGTWNSLQQLNLSSNQLQGSIPGDPPCISRTVGSGTEVHALVGKQPVKLSQCDETREMGPRTPILCALQPAGAQTTPGGRRCRRRTSSQGTSSVGTCRRGSLLCAPPGSL